MRPSYKTVGAIGEEYVARLLSRRGFKVQARNYRYKRLGELDLILTKGDCLFSIEVKTFRGISPFVYQDKIDNRKMYRIYKLTEIYVRNAGFGNKYRIFHYVAFVQLLNEGQTLSPTLKFRHSFVRI